MEAKEAVALAAAGIVRSQNLPGDTIPRKFRAAVSARGPRVAMRQKELGIWEEVTWTELGAHVGHIAQAMVADGFEPGDTASILSNTRREWTYADYGILCAGGISSGIYPTDAASQVEYLLADSDSSIVFVEDEEQLDKVLEVRSRLPKLRRIVVFDMEGLAQVDDPQVISLQAFEQVGIGHASKNPGELDRRIDHRQPDDVAILVYTSGTTGRPKGAMITHRNLCYVMEHYAPELAQGEDDDKMAFLPLCHVAERMFGQFLSLQFGARLNYVENPETVAENVREIAPTVMLAVPRVWEKFYSAIQIAVREATPLQRRAYAFALAIGYRVADLRLAGRPVPALLALANRLLRFFVLDNIRRVIGVHRARYGVTGAAPISPELLRWFAALGVDIYEVWGMTETTGGGTVNLPGKRRLGTVGPASPFNEIRISSEGEILVRGPNVIKGYLNLPEKTREAIDEEGWLHTGDVGSIDADGFVKITDRMKDIIITAGGKNVTPSEIENELKFSPYVTDAVVVGDRRPYLTCLVMIDHENVERFAQEHAVPFSNFASLCRAAEVQALIQAEIDRVNGRFARVEQIKKFRLIEFKLTAEDEELTPTMKLKRKLVNEKYADLIGSMYSS
ncbi:MAG: long-chain fatty acid--CoA ligase [Burkholderiaceae bacterium]|nr:long-chain fatty acid--CoA ligase [Burkholderiaceae bacterium]